MLLGRSWGEWAVVIGVLLEVGGIGTVLYGVDSLKAELFPERLLPISRLKAWWASRNSPSVTGSVSVTASPATLRLQANAGAVTVSPRTVEERLTLLAADITKVENALLSESDERRTEIADVRGALDHLRAHVDAADHATFERIRTAQGGRDGRGLTIAFYGTAAALFGALLQGIGS